MKPLSVKVINKGGNDLLIAKGLFLGKPKGFNNNQEHLGNYCHTRIGKDTKKKDRSSKK